MLTIVSALKSELAPLMSSFKIETKYKIGSGTLSIADKVHFLRIGIGQTTGLPNFKLYLDQYAPDRILNIGFAGSMHSSSGLDRIYNIRGAVNKSTQSQIELDTFGQNNFSNATLLTVDQALTDSKLRDTLFKKFQTDLVDMETWYLAHYSAKKLIQFFSIKIVSDQADQFTAESFMANYQELAKKLAIAVLPLIQQRMKIS